MLTIHYFAWYLLSVWNFFSQFLLKLFLPYFNMSLPIGLKFHGIINNVFMFHLTFIFFSVFSNLFSPLIFPGCFNWLSFQFIIHCLAGSNLLFNLFAKFLKFSYFIFAKYKDAILFPLSTLYRFKISMKFSFFKFIILNILIMVILKANIWFICLNCLVFLLFLFDPVSLHV